MTIGAVRPEDFQEEYVTKVRGLERVRTKIQDVVLRFCRRNLMRTFYAEDLLRYCRVLQPVIAPDSPSRILRLLRKEGIVIVELVSRTASMYRVLWVAPA